MTTSTWKMLSWADLDRTGTQIRPVLIKRTHCPRLSFSLLSLGGVMHYILLSLLRVSLTHFLHNVIVGWESEERCCVYSVTHTTLWKQAFFLAKNRNKQNQNAVLCVFFFFVCVCVHNTGSAGNFLTLGKLLKFMF